MKTTTTLFLALLLAIGMNGYAQEKNQTKEDQLKTEILNKLNDKSAKFRIHLLPHYEEVKPIDIDNNGFVVKTKKGKITSISLLEKINYHTYGGVGYSGTNWIMVIADTLQIENSVEKRAKEFYQLMAALRKYQFSDIMEGQIAEFQGMATYYKVLREKPTITEEQRKYIVQANSKNEKKEYQEALDLYKKAIKVNSVSYPSAYNNMALIAAQIQDYWYAILNMKKYLMLVPEASDARAAQDKIYEWEAELEK